MKESAMNPIRRNLKIGILVSALTFLIIPARPFQAISPRPEQAAVPAGGSGGMLDQGLISKRAPGFIFKLVRSTQTVAALKPRGAAGFDFTPGGLLAERSLNGYVHLGDLNLRIRKGTAGAWTDFSTSAVRKPVLALAAEGPVLAAADLAPTLGPDCPLKVTRSWVVENGKLILRFELKNPSETPVQVGGLGIPMVFNNAINDRELEEAHAVCSFSDPYIGVDAGYLQVTRLSGLGPVLLVVPDGRTPFEAYNPILNPRRRPGDSISIFTDLTPRGQTFEGFGEWLVHSQAYAETEWKQVRPWNSPTLLTLAPGESKTYGLKFLLADEIRKIEETLAVNGRPVAVGIPGYVLPTDIDGKLFLRYPQAVKSMDVEPREAVAINGNAATAGGWKAYTLRGKALGRARLTVAYEDGLVQTIQYFVTKSQAEAVDDLGRFLTTKQWFVDPADPFKRSPSVMGYDREENRIITQDSRVWVAGLGDEGGSSWLTGAMKLFGRPDQAQADKYQEFVDKVLWGGLQYKDGPSQYAVRKGLFYYQPDQMPAGFYRKDLNWGSWTSWKKADTEKTDRSYNYPHVAALHWTMYRLARNHVGLIANHPWDWYLGNAYQTILAMMRFAPHYTQFGQMEGTVFLEILLDLKREGWTTEAADLEAKMKSRAEIWKSKAYPFGSEMAWDSTGQEEVYAWTKYFGDPGKAEVTLNAILGYMPTVPHWGYNGNARRYWDFLYAGKISRIERQIHHYGSSLNAIPVLSAFRDRPEDFYLLRVGYGGTMGTLTNIDPEGFASAAFHSFPDTLKPDPISGDFAPNFFGHALNTAAYLTEHPEFGWTAFGGNVEVRGPVVRLTPLDSFRSRVFLAPLGLWLTLEAGTFASVELNTETRRVRVALSKTSKFTPNARLRVEHPAGMGAGTAAGYRPIADFKLERGAYVVPLAAAETWIELKD
jgi:hypothetical protein